MGKSGRARSFENAAAIVSFNNRFGVLNTKGIIIVPIIFDDVQKINDKLYVTKIGDSKTLIFTINFIIENRR